MEMPLMGWPPNDTIMNSSYEIQNANYPNIRFATVQRAYSNEKQSDCLAIWQECSPKTAGDFSATAFFFGRKLHKELNVPIGLIHSSWGGTPVEAWTSEEFIGRFDVYKPVIENLKHSSDEIRNYKAWLSVHQVHDVRLKETVEKYKNLDFFDEVCSAVNLDDSEWQEMTLPGLWENTQVGNFDGVIWFRKKVKLGENLTNKELILVLGPIDDIDRTYVNGVLVGAYEEDGHYQTERIYKIPLDVIQKQSGSVDNEITIAVRVMDMRGGGGMYGDAAKMRLYSAGSTEVIPLSGSWKYMIAGEYMEGVFYLFDPVKNEYNSKPKLSVDLSPMTPTSLYNAMIHPLVPYAIKGAIWYQGESNTDKPEMYSSLFTAMIDNWRKDWDLGDFPFYYAQIAPYNYGSITHSELLREAQLRTLSVKNTGMIVTMDIGNPDNIHPANKTDVGERLARWALAKDYKKDVKYSGPVYKSMKTKKDRIVLTFRYEKGLNVKPVNGNNGFLIAGEDKIFKEAQVEIKDNKIYVFHPEVKDPKAVRYAWSNTADATLFNGAGLPASTFRTDDWE